MAFETVYDISQTYYDEANQYAALVTLIGRTTTGNVSFTSASSGITYNSTTGQTGLLNILQATPLAGKIVTALYLNGISSAVSTMQTDFTLKKITASTLGSDVASLSFTGLSSYKYLQLRWNAWSTTTDTSDDSAYLTFNDDTGSNYAYQIHGARSTTHDISSSNLQTAIRIPYAFSKLSNKSKCGVIDIFNNIASSPKTILSKHSGYGYNFGYWDVGGYWADTTNEITKITITILTYNIATGGTFELWGTT